MTVELVDEFKKAIPFQTVEHKPWRNVLTVCLGGIGDMIMITPFLRELKRNHPTSRITLITTPITLELMSVFPLVDDVRAFDWKKNIGTLRTRMNNARQFVDDILQSKSIDAFDAAILPIWSAEMYGASFLIFFSRAAKRIGFSENVIDLKAKSNKNFNLLFTDVVDERTLHHEVNNGLLLLQHVNDVVVNRNLELFTNAEAHSKVAQLLDENLDCDCKLIVLGVAATAPYRTWDIKNFVNLINRLHEWRNDLRFLIVGGRDAVDKAAYIIENTPRGITVDLTNRLKLYETVALCSRASIYIGNNTGVMHIAAACGMKCIVLISMSKDGDDFFTDSAARTQPFGEGHVILQPAHALDDCVGYCQKPYAHCINQITVEEVFEGVKRIVEQK